MKPTRKETTPPAPVSSENTAPKRRRSPSDVRRDNVRTDIGGDEPKILGR